MSPMMRFTRTRKRRVVAIAAAGALVATGLTVLTASPANAATACQVTYSKRADWGSGFTGSLALKNQGDAWTSWKLTFDFAGNQVVSQGWNGNFAQTSKTVTVTNASWNGSVASGGTVADVGFNGSYTGTNADPTNFAVNGVPCNGVQPTTAGPTTARPTTAGPTTAGPTTAGPTTAGPTTAGPTTGGPTSGPVNQAPTVSISAPSANQRYTAPANITINANATDADGSIAKVEFYHDGLLLGTDTSAPYSYTWSGVPAQTAAYHLQAKAYDNLGLVSPTVPDVPVFVDTATTPTLSVTPTSLTVGEGASKTFTVALSSAPSASTTVNITKVSGGDADLTASPTSLTFTTSNWATAQTVTVTAAQDTDSTAGTASFTVAATGYTSVIVSATETDDDGTPVDTYTQRFLDQYNKIKAPANGYFSPEGVPYHAVETLVVEAPDHGHETTSEAFSYYLWLEAYYGKVTKDWTRFNQAWAVMDNYIIPAHTKQTTNNYHADDPADYAPEADQPSLYPQQGGALDSNVKVGADPLYSELVSTYGNTDVYGMHWILDVDNVYGFTGCGSKVSYINTYQRGPQESVWETVAHPSCDDFTYGQPSAGYLPLFISGTPAKQWRYTDAPDADARAVQAAYWAKTWAGEQGKGADVSATVTKAAKMGDYLRYAMYDKYFKKPGCTSTSCAAGTGKDSSNYLLSWYYAWGGGAANDWSWRIGSSHNHQGYQNPLAAYVLANDSALKPKSPTAATDWATSTTRQIEFYTWLQSADGAIAGGATNSVGGAYKAPASGTPTFYGLFYDDNPVYHDPGSNTWFGFQAWSLERVAEYYYVTNDAKAKAVLDKWVTWAIANTTVSGSTFAIPSTLEWSGKPGGNWASGTTSVNNANLRVTVKDKGTDVGVAAAYARLLTFYGAKANNASAKTTAKALLDAIWAHADTKGVGIAETREDYKRFDDVWSSSNQDGLYIPSGFNGKMPNGDVIAPGKTFLDIRSFYKNDPDWAKVQAYLNGGAAPTFTFHRFWAQSDIAMAMSDYATLIGS
jgi:hypothetical protein